MKYESVLGYSKNTLIEDYQERYFHKLLTNLHEMMGHTDQMQMFVGYNKEQQQDFLLHPDISSLIRDIELHGSQKSQDKLLEELGYFFEKQTQKLSSFQGEYIPGTQIKLTTIDNNPDNSIVHHPDHDQGGMIGWGEKTETQWLEVFTKSFQLLREINEEYFNELNSIIKKIVPMKTSYGVHNSCSYKECIGTLYLGYTIDSQFPELNILEALIHESNHNKLNLIMQSEDLHSNDYGLKYYSPYRPDARHIQGVILGVHALVSAVYVMLEGIEQGKIIDIQWQEKVFLYHIKNKLGMNVIQRHANLTGVGEKLIQDMQDVMKLCDIKIRDSGLLKKIDVKGVQQRAKEHFIEVQRNYPFLQY